jgi:hypothetical protein
MSEAAQEQRAEWVVLIEGSAPEPRRRGRRAPHSSVSPVALPERGKLRCMVRVEPVRPEWAQALAEGDAVFAERFGIPVEAGWSGFPEALPILLEATKTGSVTGWGPHLFFDDDGALVGNGEWKGPPAEGVAELGYAVAPSRQRRGSQRQSYESSSNALAGQVFGPSPLTPSPRKTRRPRCSSAADSPESPSSSIPMRAQSGAGNSRSAPRSARPNSTGCAATATETRPGRLNPG